MSEEKGLVEQVEDGFEEVIDELSQHWSSIDCYREAVINNLRRLSSEVIQTLKNLLEENELFQDNIELLNKKLRKKSEKLDYVIGELSCVVIENERLKERLKKYAEGVGEPSSRTPD